MGLFLFLWAKLLQKCEMAKEESPIRRGKIPKRYEKGELTFGGLVFSL
jgi:hypothetical protein